MTEGTQRICPRCGAPYDPYKSKCPYCLTSYFDMSSIDISDSKPFYLKLKSGGRVFTALVKTSDAQLDFTEETIACCGRRNDAKILQTSFVLSKQVDISIKFNAVVDRSDNAETLFKVSMEDY